MLSCLTLQSIWSLKRNSDAAGRSSGSACRAQLLENRRWPKNQTNLFISSQKIKTINRPCKSYAEEALRPTCAASGRAAGNSLQSRALLRTGSPEFPVIRPCRLWTWFESWNQTGATGAERYQPQRRLVWIELPENYPPLFYLSTANLNDDTPNGPDVGGTSVSLAIRFSENFRSHIC